MNLIIDIGNTRTKWAVFDNQKLIRSGHLPKLSTEFLNKLISEFQIDNSIVSHVAEIRREIVGWIHKHTNNIAFDHETTTPFSSTYKTPNTLGLDRIALTAGAFDEYPNSNTLIIDAGTCITYDFIDDSNTYHGGAISPGIEMRFKSLPHFTYALPYVNDRILKDFIGKSTEESIISGVLNGVFNEVDGVISQYKSRYQNLQVVITGGDIIFFDGRLKNDFFARPELMLFGLNVLANLNA